MLSKLQEAMKKAMKDKDSQRLQVIRMLLSEVKNEGFSSSEKKRSGEEVVASYHKKLVKAKTEFPDKKEYVENLAYEIKIVEEFLPKQMSKDEIISFIKANVQDVQLKTVMPLLKGKADSKLVQEIIAQWPK